MEEDNIARIDNRRARLQRLGALVNPETIKQYMFGTDVASSCPLSGLPDEPENYHTVTISVTRDGSRTRLVLIQNRNPTAEAREHYEKNWTMVLAGLKKLLEE